MINQRQMSVPEDFEPRKKIEPGGGGIRPGSSRGYCGWL